MTKILYNYYWVKQEVSEDEWKSVRDFENSNHPDAKKICAMPDLSRGFLIKYQKRKLRLKNEKTNI